jgi:hypothetical protein
MTPHLTRKRLRRALVKTASTPEFYRRLAAAKAARRLSA